MHWCFIIDMNTKMPQERKFDTKETTMPSIRIKWSGVFHYTWRVLQMSFRGVVNSRIVWPICSVSCHDDVIKWKHFPRYWPFVRVIHRSPVNSPHKGQWRVALMFSLISVWINDWVNNRKADDLRRYRSHYDVTVMYWKIDDVSASWMQSRHLISNTNYTAVAVRCLHPRK